MLSEDAKWFMKHMTDPIKELQAEVRALRAEVQQLRNPTVPVRGSVRSDGTIHWWGMEREGTADQ